MGISLKNVNTNFQKLLFCSVSAACLASIPVAPAYSAGNTYLLQLGSFDTKEQAVQKWQELKEKNPDILGSINPHITEVAMGDNDKVNYRTEAGPLDSRETATKLCTELQAKGAECAVVETAMFTDDAPAAEAPAAAPAKEEAKKEEPAPTPAPAPEAHPVQEAATASAAAPAPVESPTPAPAPSHGDANSADVPVPTQSVAYVPGREPKFLDEGNPVSVSTAQPAAPQTVAAEEKPAATSAVHDLAAAEPQHTDKIIPERAPRFLDDTPTAAAAAAPQPQPQPEVQTAAAESAAEPASAKTVDSDDDDESPAESRRPALFGHKQRAGHEVATTRAVHAEAATAANEQPSQKRPGFFARLFGSSEAAKEQPKAPEMAAAAPPPAPEAAPVSAAAPAAARDVEGNVSVAEAIRVPLTDGKSKPQTALPSQDKAFKPALTIGGNYWAQINYFANEAKAHEFYEQFRGIYPELSDGMRMSISRPYAYANAPGHVTLRIGSFATLNDIGVICSIAAQHNLHCVSIYEGQNISPGTTASSSNLPHEHVMSEITVDKSVPAAEGGLFHTVDNPVFWVQLGSYDSPDDAWDKWRDIQKHHKKVVGRASADVSQPEASAAAHKLFRLRAGPFTTQASADFLCGKLSKSGEDCLVVSER